MTNNRTCNRCGSIYQPKRITSKFCSSDCRVNAHLGKGHGGDRKSSRRNGDLNPAERLFEKTGTFDPRGILEAIASDENEPGMVRVAACRAWAALSAGGPLAKKEKALVSLNERALELMAGSSPLVH